MNNNTTNPFEDAESNFNPIDDNNSENVDFGNNYDYDNQERNFVRGNFFNQYPEDESDTDYYQNENEDYNNEEGNYYEESDNYEDSYNNDQAEYNRPGEQKNNNSIIKKLSIIFFIIVLLVILVLLLKSLLGSNVTEDENDNGNTYVNENINTDEATLNRRYKIEPIVLANKNILLNIHNKNNVSVDAIVTIDYYDDNNEIVKTSDIEVKNIPSKSHYYEAVYVEDSLKGKEFKVNAKLTLNKYKDYFKDKVEILKQEPDSENLLIELKNDSNSVIDVINIFVVYYDSTGNIIGYDENSAKKVQVDGVSVLKMNYPKGADYKFVSYSKYEVGINTAYSYKEK